MFRPVSACAHVRAMQSIRVPDADVYAEGRRRHVCDICAATTCKVALSSIVFFFFFFFFFFEVHVDIHYVRVTVVNGLRIMTIA